MNSKFPTNVKQLRIKNGVTQQQLADVMSVTATGVSYWESGKAVPSYETLQKLADYFNVSLDTLMGNESDKNDDDDFMILFRKAEQVDEDDKEKLKDILKSTIDVFLKNNEK